MNQILKIKEQERRDHLSEFMNRVNFAQRVMEDVYSKREKELKKKQAIISELLADGDFDAVMVKLSEISHFMSESLDEEIKKRLSEYNLINRTEIKE